jgi:hypothetical protein
VSPVLRRLPRTARRAFSLLEVTAAAALFAVITIGITLAVSSALSSRASSAIKYRLAAELEASLNEISYTPFATLLADTFTPPSPCADSVFLGTKGTSCLTVAERDFTVSWAILLAGDSITASTEAVDALTVIATTELPDGSTLTRSRRILAPTPGFNGESVLRVQLSGQYDAIDGPLFLVSATAPDSLVASAPLGSYGTALFRVPSTDCTAAAPCRLALSVSNTWSTDGTVALSSASTIGPDAALVLTPGKVLQVGAEVFTPSTVYVELYAESDAGSRAPATVKDSICVWAVFNDGSADRLLPACNDSIASSVQFSTYPVDPTNPALRAPIPPGSPIRFYVDHPNGSCPDIGQLGARAGLWESAAVCTSWTWGVPSKISLAGTDYGLDQAFRLPSGTTSFNLTWSGALARPAAGYSDRPLWVNPRAYGACASSASCTSTLTTAPEDSLCPGEFCLSSRVPSLLGPSTGSVYAKQITASTSTIDLVIKDEYGDPVQVQLLTEPQSGTLSYDDTPLSAGDIITTTASSGPETVSLVFEESSTIEMVFFEVRLSNTVQDGIRDYEIALYRTPRPWLFAPTPAALTQSSTTTVYVDLTGTDSSPSANETVSISTPSGLTAPLSAVSDASGRLSFQLTAGAIAPGSYTIDLTTDTGRATTVPVSVSQKATSISFTAANLAQAATTSVTATVLDALSNPMANAPVSFRTAASGFSPGLRTSPTGCSTNASGTCTVTLVADLATAAGSYTLTGSSGTASFSDPFTVTATPGSLTALPFTIRQGASGTWTLVLKDGSGLPLSGRTVSVDSTPVGLSFTPTSRVSTISGAVSFTVETSATATVGPATVSFLVGSESFTASFPLTATPATLVPPASISLQRGSVYATSVRVLDASGDPVSAVPLVLDPLSGVSFTSTPSDSDGYAAVLINVAPTAAKGSFTVSYATAAPVLTGSFPLVISAAPQSIALTGSLPQGGFSSLSVSVLDSDADPVPGAVVTLSGLPPSVDVPPRSLTNASGVALLPVADLATTALGTYRVKLTVSLDSTLRLFPASVPVVSAASQASAPAALAAPSVTSTSSTSLTVSFTPPTLAGGSAVSSYQLYVNGSLYSSPLSSPATVSTLTANTRYSLALVACNLSGCSPVSASSYAYTLMESPSDLTASASAAGSLAVSWTNPSQTPAALTLRVKPSASGTWSTRILSVTSTTHTLRGLDPVTSYDIQIGAANDSGTAWSSTFTTSTS